MLKIIKGFIIIWGIREIVMTIIAGPALVKMGLSGSIWMTLWVGFCMVAGTAFQIWFSMKAYKKLKERTARA